MAYNETIAARIVEEFAGDKTLTEICKLDWAPSRTTVNNWEKKNADFNERMNVARKLKADAIADQIAAIIKKEKDPSRMRAQVDGLRWLAKCYNPVVYGDRVQVDVEHKVTLGDALQLAQQRLLSISDQSPDEKNQLIDITPQIDATPTDTQSVDLDNEPDFMQ